MTIQQYQRLLKRINPNLKIRQRHFGDVAGVFVGVSGRRGYICRLSKGEFNLNGYRITVFDPMQLANTDSGRIVKRGRKTVNNLLRNYRWVNNHYQRTMLTYGIEYPDEKIKVATGRDQHGTYY